MDSSKNIGRFFNEDQVVVKIIENGGLISGEPRKGKRYAGRKLPALDLGNDLPGDLKITHLREQLLALLAVQYPLSHRNESGFVERSRGALSFRIEGSNLLQLIAHELEPKRLRDSGRMNVQYSAPTGEVSGRDYRVLIAVSAVHENVLDPLRVELVPSAEVHNPLLENVRKGGSVKERGCRCDDDRRLRVDKSRESPGASSDGFEVRRQPAIGIDLKGRKAQHFFIVPGSG